MLWLYLLAVVLLGTVVALLLGRWDGAAVPEEESDLAQSDVDELLRRRADQRITAHDLQQVQLDSAMRGYRMDQVDRLLDALTEQLQAFQEAPAGWKENPPGAAAEPRGDRIHSPLGHDSSPRDVLRGSADQHLSPHSRTDPKPGDPPVE